MQIVPKTKLRVTVLREDGTIVPPARFAKGWYAYIGTPGQQHSGVEDCLMRYDMATAYASTTQPLTRYQVDKEMSGLSLCTRKVDPGGVNAASHRPQSRYGDALVGNCRGQLRVKDGP